MKNIINESRNKVLDLEVKRNLNHYKPGWLFWRCKELGLERELEELTAEGALVPKWSQEKRNKLTLELVPLLAHYTNVRSNVSKEEWDSIRESAYKKANYCCEVCGGIGIKHRVECHELWNYDDENMVQKLTGFISLCPYCHEVKHMGFANIQGRGKEARKHLSDINSWTKDKTDKYVDEQFDVWSQRSHFPWELDISLLNSNDNESKTVIINGKHYKIVRELH